MREVTVDVHISAPRADVFDFVADLAGRPAWTDHYLKDYRLARAIDRFRQTGAAWWIGRNTKMALERLRLVFEDPPARPLARVTVAGYEPLKAPRFGGPTGMDPARPRR